MLQTLLLQEHGGFGIIAGFTVGFLQKQGPPRGIVGRGTLSGGPGTEMVACGGLGISWGLTTKG